MMDQYINLVDISISVPTVPYDLSLKELKALFRELGFYKYLIVLKEGIPIGIVYRNQVERISREHLIAGDLTHLCCRLRNTSVAKESLAGIFDVLPLEKEPVIVTDRKGTYLGILTYDTVLHYVTHHKEYILPVVHRLHTGIGKGEYFIVFGLKNTEEFKLKLGSEKLESLQKILLEDIRDIFSGEISGVPERGEVWIVSHKAPTEDQVKELFKEFHREYSLLFGEIERVHIYGYCLSLSDLKNQEELFNIKENLKKRALKVDGSVFISYGLRPTLVVHDPSKVGLISNIKSRILRDFKVIVEKLRISPKDTWEYVLYDLFEEFPYFELFYVMSSKGLQITNNIVNPKIDYFVAQGKKGTDRSDRSYFRKAMEEGSFISDVYLSKATDDFCITVSERFSYEGKIYVLAGDINFKQIHKLVKELS